MVRHTCREINLDRSFIASTNTLYRSRNQVGAGLIVKAQEGESMSYHQLHTSCLVCDAPEFEPQGLNNFFELCEIASINTVTGWAKDDPNGALQVRERTVDVASITETASSDCTAVSFARPAPCDGLEQFSTIILFLQRRSGFNGVPTSHVMLKSVSQSFVHPPGRQAPCSLWQGVLSACLSQLQAWTQIKWLVVAQILRCRWSAVTHMSSQ